MRPGRGRACGSLRCTCAELCGASCGLVRLRVASCGFVWPRAASCGLGGVGAAHDLVHRALRVERVHRARRADQLAKPQRSLQRAMPASASRPTLSSHPQQRRWSGGSRSRSESGSWSRCRTWPYMAPASTITSPSRTTCLSSSSSSRPYSPYWSSDRPITRSCAPATLSAPHAAAGARRRARKGGHLGVEHQRADKGALHLVGPCAGAARVSTGSLRGLTGQRDMAGSCTG